MISFIIFKDALLPTKVVINNKERNKGCKTILYFVVPNIYIISLCFFIVFPYKYNNNVFFVLLCIVNFLWKDFCIKKRNEKKRKNRRTFIMCWRKHHNFCCCVMLNWKWKKTLNVNFIAFFLSSLFFYLGWSWITFKVKEKGVVGCERNRSENCCDIYSHFTTFHDNLIIAWKHGE